MTPKIKEFAEKKYQVSKSMTDKLLVRQNARKNGLIEGILIGAEFAEWVTHNDWVYLPSKQKWYNEEDEENITPKTTPELLDIFINEKMNINP